MSTTSLFCSEVKPIFGLTLAPQFFRKSAFILYIVVGSLWCYQMLCSLVLKLSPDSLCSRVVCNLADEGMFVISEKSRGGNGECRNRSETLPERIYWVSFSGGLLIQTSFGMANSFGAERTKRSA